MAPGVDSDSACKDREAEGTGWRLVAEEGGRVALERPASDTSAAAVVAAVSPLALSLSFSASESLGAAGRSAEKWIFLRCAPLEPGLSFPRA